MFVFLLLFLPIVCFTQDFITIPRYSIVYEYTNSTINIVSEIYFDHQQKLYLTNSFTLNNPDAFSILILNKNQTTPVIINHTITYKSSTKKRSSKNLDKKKGFSFSKRMEKTK